ncbi:TetR/AcrR family transcriptional regulator [Sphingomonas sp. RB3P16]|uniref:TetR/AcrR family transcriptional regulator n=1 Tax=Parasphingomonas frigoris TaxID=3096163 RepID=UPI002FC61D80
MAADREAKRVSGTDPRAVRSRDAILAAAVRLLESAGAHEINHTLVAAEAGVGRATVYRHWPEPWELLLEAMEIVIPAIDFGDGPIRERLLRELGRRIAWFNSSIASAALAAIIERADHEPRLRLMRDRSLGRANAMLRDEIAQAARNGELRPETPADVLAKALVGTLLFERRLLGQNLTEEGVARVVDALLTGWLIEDR